MNHNNDLKIDFAVLSAAALLIAGIAYHEGLKMVCAGILVALTVISFFALGIILKEE